MTIIECQSDLDIATVETLRQQLLRATRAREPLEIDGRAVRKVHTAALQLFLSALAEIQSLGLPLHWREPSPALVEGARLLGLTNNLKLGEL